MAFVPERITEKPVEQPVCKWAVIKTVFPKLPDRRGYHFYKRVLSNSPVLVSCFLGYYVLLRSLCSESVPLLEKVSSAVRYKKSTALFSKCKRAAVGNLFYHMPLKKRTAKTIRKEQHLTKPKKHTIIIYMQNSCAPYIMRRKDKDDDGDSSHLEEV